MLFRNGGAALLFLLLAASRAFAASTPVFGPAHFDSKGPIRIVIGTTRDGALVWALNLSSHTRVIHLTVAHYKNAATGETESRQESISLGPYADSGPILLSAIEPSPSWLESWTVDPAADPVEQWAGYAPLETPAPDREAHPIYRKAPTYPQWCMADARDEETVFVRFIVSERGTTKSARVLRSTDKCLEQPALWAISSWLYAPKIQNGKPVISTYEEVPIVFRLSG
ncbi:MAG: TonB family protein [Alphaproteobacteria bacterium]|nr:TonB family protein [Alphaproteobacteria bacterium]